MTKAFIGEDFLLETDLARHLFHDVAKDLPIVYYHCHLPPDQIRSNHRFRSITEIWLDGDHYKWRAMRANGVSERFCTGEATDFEKFEAWAKTVPETIRTGTLSKAFGCFGGFVAGSASVIAGVREYSTAFIGATPIPIPLDTTATTNRIPP